MKTPKPKKPASPRVRRLRSKLEALASVGIEGEKVSAQEKLERLLKRYDFMAPEVKLGDMFGGKFIPSPVSRHLAMFAQCDQDIASAVKWAIESATGLNASFRGDELLVEVDVSCLPQLTSIADRITNGCRLLWERFERAPGITPRDQGLFLRGIYDGMMDDKRRDGELLPPRRIEAVKATRKRNALATAPGIGVHPYTVALDLGRQLRFETPVTDIVGSLEEKIGVRKVLSERT
jgi:hypothetical protein